ncbi:MAG: hypothetical protein LBB23_00870 [Rickettsiales bacterium]|jgi:hypothetical protein|nr:hypothetical protein [Rickettsiales bacterium]
MLLDLQNIDCKLQDIDTQSEEIQLKMYEWLQAQFKNSPKLYGKSFEKISDSEYRMFKHSYSPSQILVINANGQKTMDGNDKFYWQPEYKLDEKDNDFIGNNFSKFVELGAKYQINIDQFLIIPAKFHDGDYAKCVGKAVPEEYNFNKPTRWCRALGVPVQDNGQALNFGIFVGNRLDGIRNFAWSAGRIAVSCGGCCSDFNDSFRAALDRLNKSKSM